MPQENRTGILVSSGIVLIMCGCLIWYQQRQQMHWVRDLQLQIKRDLLLEQAPFIRKMVQKEVAAVYQQRLVLRQDTPAGQGSGLMVAMTPHPVSSLDLNQGDSPEILREAIHRVVQEIWEEREALQQGTRIVSNAVLDTQVGGAAIEPDTVIHGGIIKRPQMDDSAQLAALGDSSQSLADDSALDSESGGLEESQPESIERTMQQKGSVLLAKGRKIFEPGFTYAHFSTNRINIQGVTILDVFTIGPVSTEKIQRDMMIQTFGFKYGLTDNLQAEIRIPFRYEFDRISSSDQSSESTRSKGGLGDIDLSLARQIGWEDGWKPDLIASIGLKTITGEPIYNNTIGLGTGHWSLRGSLVAAKSSDPSVIFGSLSYNHSFERSFDNYGAVQPGDTIGYSLGMALALSYKTALNFSFDQSLTQKLKRGGEAVVGSFVNAANFKAGVNWALNDRASVDISTAFGLTADSPDFTVEVRVPIYF